MLTAAPVRSPPNTPLSKAARTRPTTSRPSACPVTAEKLPLNGDKGPACRRAAGPPPAPGGTAEAPTADSVAYVRQESAIHAFGVSKPGA
jgi:hypothetical protein